MDNKMIFFPIGGISPDEVINSLVAIGKYLERYAQAAERGDINDSNRPDYANDIRREAETLRSICSALITLNDVNKKEARHG